MSRSPLRIRCRTPEEARYVVSLLLSRRVEPGDIQVLSAEPIHEIGDSLSRRSRLPFFTLTGAVVGAGAGYGLAAVTARLYPLNTGGMPIVAPLTVGIVTYEVTMLMAVLFTVAGLVLEGGLLRRRSADYDAAIANDEVHVLARVSSESEAEELRLLVENGRHSSEA